MYLLFPSEQKNGEVEFSEDPTDFNYRIDAPILLNIGDVLYTEKQLKEIIEQAWKYRELCK